MDDYLILGGAVEERVRVMRYGALVEFSLVLVEDERLVGGFHIRNFYEIIATGKDAVARIVVGVFKRIQYGYGVDVVWFFASAAGECNGQESELDCYVSHGGIVMVVEEEVKGYWLAFPR